MHFYSPHILSASEDTTPVAADARSGLPAKLVTPVATPPIKNRQRKLAAKNQGLLVIILCLENAY